MSCFPDFLRQLGPRLSTIVLTLLLLNACSDGGLDSDTDEQKPLVVVNAGPNRSVDENTTVSLSGSAVGQSSTLTYRWRAVPNITIVQEDPNSATASFLAPTTSVPLSYVLTLEVSDEQGNKGSDSLDIQVQPVNLAPIADISVAPFKGLAVNQFPAGVEVTLDASGSYDPDNLDDSGAIVSYQWQQSAGQAVFNGISTEGATITFVTPILVDDHELSFEVKVSDNEQATASQSITLNIQSASHTLPQVDAGIDHQVSSGELMLLNGIATTTVPAALPLKVRWLTDSELGPVIVQSQVSQTYAIAPAVSSAKTVTFTLEVSDNFGNVVVDSINVGIRPLLIRPLNDSGVTAQGTTSAVGVVYQPDYPGQDGQRGADVIAANGQLEKAGRGEQGFDFTRLDAIGDEVDDTAQDWACVRDNVTGLIWEVKTPTSDLGLHSSAHTYTWYLSEVEDDPTGTQTGTNASCSLTECNTTTFVEAVNSQGLCNFNDWRMPSHQELLSLVHFGRATGPMLDDFYFPHTISSASGAVWYWTNQSSADGAAGEQSSTAWAVDFNSGNDNFLAKSTAVNIRLVRAGR
jgi:chitinase